MKEQVILVNEQDEELGSMEKLEAHQKGLLHRAFSIFIFNDKGEMLLQQRALTKYHSGGKWSNACCSHPQPGEDLGTAAKRRLNEELGFETHLDKIFYFTYKAEFENGLIEHEFDHVFAGLHKGKIIPNPDEVKDCAFKSIGEIKSSLQTDPESFTKWFLLAFPKIEIWWRGSFSNMQ